MNHPNVARVFDAGVTEQGRPYFVMEYVPGIRITEYCDLRCLSVRERLELFTKVCEATQHAHQKGVIHRDIKPSNVLVATEYGEPVPKVIDFGLAKATGQQLTARTLFTRQGVLIGTPEYMSPEQAGPALPRPHPADHLGNVRQTVRAHGGACEGGRIGSLAAVVMTDSGRQVTG